MKGESVGEVCGKKQFGVVPDARRIPEGCCADGEEEILAGGGRTPGQADYAAVGIEQLKKLDGFNARRQEIAARLGERLEGIRGLTLPWTDPDSTHVYHLYVVQIESDFAVDKTDFMWEMYTAYGIKVWNNYMPIHLTKPYMDRGHRAGECPVTEAAFQKYVSIPIHPRLGDEAVDYVADCIRKIAR